MYASAQGVQSDWTVLDYQHKGYSNGDNDIILKAAPFLLIAVDFFLLILVTTILIKVAPKLYQGIASQTHRGNQYYSFFWAAVLVASVYNILILSFEITGVVMLDDLYTLCDDGDFCSAPLGFERHYDFTVRVARGITIYKFISIWILLIFDLLIAACIPKSPVFPIPRGLNIISYILCCTFGCVQNTRSKFIQTLAIWSLCVFVHLLTVGALASIVWVFVLPLRILSVAALLYATLFSTTAFIALLIKNLRLLSNASSWHRRCSILQPMIILVPFMAIMFIISIFCIRFIALGIEPNSIGGYAVSFIPSAILTVLGWFVIKGKVFDRLFSAESKSQTDNDLNDLEEGGKPQLTYSKMGNTNRSLFMSMPLLAN